MIHEIGGENRENWYEETEQKKAKSEQVGIGVLKVEIV